MQHTQLQRCVRLIACEEADGSILTTWLTRPHWQGAIVNALAIAKVAAALVRRRALFQPAYPCPYSIALCYCLRIRDICICFAFLLSCRWSSTAGLRAIRCMPHTHKMTSRQPNPGASLIFHFSHPRSSLRPLNTNQSALLSWCSFSQRHESNTYHCYNYYGCWATPKLTCFPPECHKSLNSCRIRCGTLPVPGR